MCDMACVSVCFCVRACICVHERTCVCVCVCVCVSGFTGSRPCVIKMPGRVIKIIIILVLTTGVNPRAVSIHLGEWGIVQWMDHHPPPPPLPPDEYKFLHIYALGSDLQVIKTLITEHTNEKSITPNNVFYCSMKYEMFVCGGIYTQQCIYIRL